LQKEINYFSHIISENRVNPKRSQKDIGHKKMFMIRIIKTSNSS
jgi:hypothetical protein